MHIKEDRRKNKSKEGKGKEVEETGGKSTEE
jgi:hypothetical protein